MHVDGLLVLFATRVRFSFFFPRSPLVVAQWFARKIAGNNSDELSLSLGYC